MGLIDKLKGVAGRFGRATATYSLIGLQTFGSFARAQEVPEALVQAANHQENYWPNGEEDEEAHQRQDHLTPGGHASVYIPKQGIEPAQTQPVNGQYPKDCQELEVIISNEPAPTTWCGDVGEQTQINVITPFLEPETHSVSVRNGTEELARGEARITEKNPSIFIYHSKNKAEQRVPLAVTTDPNYRVNGFIPGTIAYTGNEFTVTIWGNAPPQVTGEDGSPPPKPGTATPLHTTYRLNNLRVLADGETQEILHAAHAPGLAGVIQANVRVRTNWEPQEPAKIIQLAFEYEIGGKTYKSTTAGIIAKQNEDTNFIAGITVPNTTITSEYPDGTIVKAHTGPSGEYAMWVPNTPGIQQATLQEANIAPSRNHYGIVATIPPGEILQAPQVEKGEPNPTTGESQLKALRQYTGNPGVGYGINFAWEKYPVNIYPNDAPLEELLKGIKAWDEEGKPSHTRLIGYDPIEAGEPGMRVKHDMNGSRAELITINGAMHQATLYIADVKRDHPGFRKQGYASTAGHEAGHGLGMNHHDGVVLMSPALSEEVRERINTTGRVSKYMSDHARAIEQLGPRGDWHAVYDHDLPPTAALKNEEPNKAAALGVPLIAAGKMYMVTREQHTLEDGCQVTVTDINGPQEYLTPKIWRTQVQPTLDRLDSTINRHTQ